MTNCKATAGAKPAVILLSGGLDSSTILAIAREQGFACHALSFNYGQRHQVELEKCREIAKFFGCASHVVVDLDLGALAPSALTGQCEVPKRDDTYEIGDEIPDTYVPARNIIFLSFAAARAEGVGARDIFLGVNAVDYSGYPDCRPEFIEAFGKALNLGTKSGVKEGDFTIHAPLIKLTKAEIITEGTRLGVDYSRTLSCYDPDVSGRACGHCESCLLRKRGFKEAGIPDPTLYK
ncbi:MAG: 7-cyano-7-deazaguanine synthase QueC [Deltaproteobacteria bacterium]|nr:MAG: 7-cyano-7-deazaguanine synthase QueC [Deltaproteobacteria bacterium]